MRSIDHNEWELNPRGNILLSDFLDITFETDSLLVNHDVHAVFI